MQNSPFISTPYHTIPCDKIVSISVGTDDQNSNICALSAHLVTGQTILFLVASHITIIHEIKAVIENNWKNNCSTDITVFIGEIAETLKEKNKNRPIVYSYISPDHLMSLYEREMKDIEGDKKWKPYKKR